MVIRMHVHFQSSNYKTLVEVCLSYESYLFPFYFKILQSHNLFQVMNKCRL
ncbi:unnamed protein product [Schistosoma mansoni]|uniref:Smp_205590 n=1 Tax=Schistosoma mansoni TaxID=6183 RepID=UPI00022C8537|nr:unnamed protein product [Schistosoma mansoni]|eukprot:XP_018644746.1 unnamed protein product [Schistosoma mansoni]